MIHERKGNFTGRRARQSRGWRAEDFHAVKDPSIVFHGGKWHLFCAVRGTRRTHAIVYMSFADFEEVGSAKQQVLPCHRGYFCAPQVFYFIRVIREIRRYLLPRDLRSPQHICVQPGDI